MMLMHPWLLGAGAAAAATPVVIHWLTKPRPRKLALSTIRFVHEAIQQRRARHKLRDWILLALRITAVVMAAVAFSRPLAESKSLATEPPAGSARIVIVDQSLSMSAISNGVSAFDRAKPIGA